MLKVGTLTVVCATVLVAAKSCTVQFGSGDPSSPGGSTVLLGVPYFQQETEMYCVPAAIQMWAAYNGNYVSQTDIANYIGCTPNGGTLLENVAKGVMRYTNAKDAYPDYDGGIGDPSVVQANFTSRQVTSLLARTPVLSVVNNGLHAGILDGGVWHTDDSTGLYVWDLVYFSDPQVGPDTRVDPGTWMEEIQSQIISRSATVSAPSELATYGPNIVARGTAFRFKPQQN